MGESFQTDINDCEKKLLELYKNTLTEQNPTCKKCKNNNDALTRPVGAWVVGNKFYSHKKRVLFVGKNARGNPGKPYCDFQFAFGSQGIIFGKNRGPIGVIPEPLQMLSMEMMTSKTLPLRIL